MKRLLFFLYILIPGILIAQWNQGTGIYGGSRIHLLEHQGKLIAGSEVGGVYVSSDTGLSWQQTPLKNNRVSQVMKNGNYATIKINSDFLNSSDGFDSWNGVNLDGMGEKISSAFGNLYADTYYGVVCSVDSGASYQAANIGQPGFNLLSERDGIVYAGGNGVYSSLDSFQTWQRIDPGFSDVREIMILDSCLLVATNIGLYRYYHGIWSISGTAGSITIFKKHNGKIIMFNNTERKLYISSDEGLSWNLCYYDDREINSVESVGQVLFISQIKGIKRSSDDGLSWVYSDSLISTQYVYGLIGNSSYLFAISWEHSILRSSDNGQSWNEIALPYSIKNNITSELKADNDTIYTTGWDVGFMISRDNGITWDHHLSDKAINAGIKRNNFLCAVDLYENVYRSMDNGLTWDSIHLSAFPHGFRTMTFLGNSIFATTNGFGHGIFRSDDFGLNWRLINSSVAPFGIKVFDDKLFMWQAGGLLVSTDSAVTWQELRPPNGTRAVGVYVRGNELWLGKEEGVFYSPDFGITWDSIGPGENIKILDIVEYNNTLHACTNMSVWSHELTPLIGIGENMNNEDAGFLLYPNPTTGNFTIRFDTPVNNTFVNIYDAFGKCVMCRKVSGGQNIIDFIGFRNGLYYAEVIENGKRSGRKIIKH